MAICDLSSREPVFVGASNVITLIPYSDITSRINLDMTGVTLVTICVAGLEADSDAATPIVSWEQRAVEGVDTWVIDVQAGLLPSIPVGEQVMRVSVVDADNPQGLVVTHDFPIDVIAAC